MRSNNEVAFEMLEGMADHIRSVVQKLSRDILLYCPVATKAEFQSAIAYLIRRLDENTGPENFLRHTFGLKPHTPQWDAQVKVFAEGCGEIQTVPIGPRRHQNRNEDPHGLDPEGVFENESDTDFALPQNRQWAHQIIDAWKEKTFEPSLVSSAEKPTMKKILKELEAILQGRAIRFTATR